MEETQRTKILEATAALVAERGVAALTLGDTMARAGVSRRVFYGCFDDRDAALLAAFDLGVERAAERIVPAYTAQSRWRDAIRAGLAELLRYIDDEPALGRLCIMHSLSGGPLLQRRRIEVQSILWEVIDRGRAQGAASRNEPPPVVAEGVVGAVATVIQTRLLAQDAESPDERPTIELFGSLMSLIALPYLGAGAARRELTRPAPASRVARGDSPGAPARYEDLGVRLTHRTGRVLQAIARYPGASNREIAERAGIVDQGQISKLLSRLEAAGVIANSGEGTSRGAPNAWRLTEHGEHVERGVEGRFGLGSADTGPGAGDGAEAGSGADVDRSSSARR
ncbi:MAG TPA: TetR family transcriptional regulator [Solirubrobacteraceae bacterium]|nr:TetR family transcriptional regulator [Solirubrobacteraceae bacterium]